MPAPSPEHARLIRQLESIIDISSEDRAAIATLPLRLKSISERRDILREGSHPVESCIIVEGMACRYKMLSNGRRQILSFHFAGDMPDLQSIYLKTMDHSLGTVTAVRLAFVPHEAVRQMMQARPGVAAALFRHALIDGSIYREWIANIGRRTSIERVAHVICECFMRMRALGLAKKNDFELPLSQGDLSDTTGLSVVHINRTMKELRRLGLIETNGGIHSILDWDMLQETADFDPGYLHLRRQVPP
jgi:CRP-like cAMP-binding protein